ncbi:hypothetical protein Tco_1153366, partial [Tanacetum coccineum]
EDNAGKLTSFPSPGYGSDCSMYAVVPGAKFTEPLNYAAKTSNSAQTLLVMSLLLVEVVEMQQHLVKDSLVTAAALQIDNEKGFICC